MVWRNSFQNIYCFEVVFNCSVIVTEPSVTDTNVVVVLGHVTVILALEREVKAQYRFVTLDGLLVLFPPPILPSRVRQRASLDCILNPGQNHSHVSSFGERHNDGHTASNE